MIKKIFFLTIVMSITMFSQPYYYYFTGNPKYTVPGYSGDIYRLNLATNSVQLFDEDVGRVNGTIFSNVDQSKIFFQERFSFAVIDVNDPSLDSKEILQGVNEILEIKDSPMLNRYYVLIEDDQDRTKTIVLDRTDPSTY